MGSTDYKKIDTIHRLNNSVNGNPRYRVRFTDGTEALTSSDAAFCYRITRRAAAQWNDRRLSDRPWLRHDEPEVER